MYALDTFMTATSNDCCSHCSCDGLRLLRSQDQRSRLLLQFFLSDNGKEQHSGWSKDQVNICTYIKSTYHTTLYRQKHAKNISNINLGCHAKPTCWNHCRQVSSCVFASLSCLKRGAAMGKQTKQSCFRTISIKHVGRNKNPTDSF